jgi:hypothetical protein
MTAADYADWCKYAGIYLGNHSHAERYRCYQRKLSQPGLVTRIVYDFLRDNARPINVNDWRSGAVYEVGTSAVFRIDQTALALEAVGAARVAAKVRAARDTSTLGKLFERPGDVQAVREFMAQMDPAKMMEQLRANIARARGQLGGGLPVSPKPPGAPDPDIESWEQIEFLLEQYVRAHESELHADRDKYGDVRGQPDFDPEKRLAELARLHQLELDREFQMDHLRELQQLMERLEKQLARKGGVPPGKVAGPRRKFLECYRRYANRPPEELLPALRDLLQKAAQFQDAYPSVFKPEPVADPRLLERLAEFGPYEVDVDSSRILVSWNAPRGLECDWTQFSLSLEFPFQDEEKLSRLLDARDRMRQRFPQHQAMMRGEVLEHFDTYRDWIGARSLTWSERDAAGNPTERAILEKAGGGRIRVETPEWADDGSPEIAVYFGVEWYDEHGLEIYLVDEAEGNPA